MSETWAPAVETADTLAAIWGLETAKWAIAFRLFDGRLQARATKIVNYLDAGAAIYTYENSDFFREFKGYTPQKHLLPTKENATIGPGLWRMSTDWEGDVSRWDWWSNKFRVTVSLDPLPQRYELQGVEFRCRDVRDPSSFRPYIAQAEEKVALLKQVAIPNQRKWDWETALAELIAIADKDGLEGAAHLKLQRARGDKAKLKTWFIKYFEARHRGSHPGIGEIDEMAKKVVDTWMKK